MNTRTDIQKQLRRELTPLERRFTRSPVYLVTMTARIKGQVNDEMLRAAIAKVRQRHVNLQARIVDDEQQNPWLIFDGAGEISIEVLPRTSENSWLEEYHRQYRIPFDFENRPPIRFILVQSEALSELIIFCHHIICDGKSLAYLARDILTCLGDPDCQLEILPEPPPINRSTIPEEVQANPLVRFFVKKVNKKWERAKVVFDQEDYENILDAYWSSFNQRIVPIELSESQTAHIVEESRRNGVTVNSALITAFAGAQLMIQGRDEYESNLGVIGSVRDRLTTPIGEAMGFYAGHTELSFKYQPQHGFWENVRRFHTRVKSLLNNKNLFKEAILYEYLEPTLIEATPFKMAGGLVPSNAKRFKKLSAFRNQNDVVTKVLKRKKVDNPDGVAMGTAITNLTRLDFPKHYGPLELDRLIMNPGISANYNLVLGALTCADKMSLIVAHIEQNLDSESVDKIIEMAMELLS